MSFAIYKTGSMPIPLPILNERPSSEMANEKQMRNGKSNSALIVVNQ
jgi:hypothetical protein